MCCDSLFSNDAKVSNINRIDFEKGLRAALRNKFFNFEEKIYWKIDGVTIWSALDLTFENALLCFHEQIWLNKCPDKFKPVYRRRYFDHIFVLFRLPNDLKKLFKF